LSEALARTRHDSALSSASDGAPRKRALRVLAGLRRLRHVLPTRVHGYAVVALGMAITVVVVNALTLQRERHPAPFFVQSGPVPAASVKLLPVHTAPLTPAENSAPSNPSPPMRPSESGGRPEVNSGSRPVDPIADQLNLEASRDKQRRWATAQTALIKLGYSVRIGDPGGPDAIAALRDFEKAHGVSISNEVTPRLVRLLIAAVNSSASQ
jgi:hypothetical protein